MNETAQRVDVHLEIEVDSQPIAGQVQVGDSVPRAFRSWLDLIAALDDAKKGEDR